MRGRRFARNLLFAVVVVGGVLLVAEATVRIVRRDGSFLIPDARVGYVNQPGFRGTWGVTRRIRVRIDALGDRIPVAASTRAPDSTRATRGGAPFRVLCLGDSCTFGFDVEGAEAYPARLESLLSERFPDRRVSVSNAGVIGHSTRHGRRRLADRLSGGERQPAPDVVVVAYNVANRVLRRTSDPDLSDPTFWTTRPVAALAKHSALAEWAYDAGLHRFSVRSSQRGWRVPYDRHDDPLYDEKVRMVLDFEELVPFVSVSEHERSLRQMVELAEANGCDVVLVTFGENPRVGGPLERADAAIEEGRFADAAEAIEEYFQEDKSDLSYQNNLDILANHLRHSARRELAFESGRDELRFPSLRSTLGGIVIRTQWRYADANDRVARSTRADHLDLRDEMNGASDLFLDFVHFGSEGHRVVASALAELLTPRLRNRDGAGEDAANPTGEQDR